MEELLTAAELAARLHKSTGSLAQWRYKGMGPPFIKLAKAVRYRARDVEVWLDAQTRQQTGERVSA
jgi:hypothetical protein